MNPITLKFFNKKLVNKKPTLSCSKNKKLSPEIC